jgi:hypothetical protein
MLLRILALRTKIDPAFLFLTIVYDALRLERESQKN